MNCAEDGVWPSDATADDRLTGFALRLPALGDERGSSERTAEDAKFRADHEGCDGMRAARVRLDRLADGLDERLLELSERAGEDDLLRVEQQVHLGDDLADGLASLPDRVDDEFVAGLGGGDEIFDGDSISFE